jgi:dTDP-4-dehydrorhamnose 3,5-epimerase
LSTAKEVTVTDALRLGNTIQFATKDPQTVSADGTPILDLVDGVQFLESKNVMTRNGVTTELFKNYVVDIRHMIHVALRPGGLAAWHLHMKQTDHVFATFGNLRVVVYDDRTDSVTHGKLNVFYLSPSRPALLVIPPGLWHGIQNIDGNESGFINFFDERFCHEDPDSWRLPSDTERIPYRFS